MLCFQMDFDYRKSMKKVNTISGKVLGIRPGIGAFKIAAAVCIALVIGWTVVVFTPWGWHTEDSEVWRFYVSLYSFGTTRNEIGEKALQHHPVIKLSQLFDTLEERDMIWMSVARWEFCRKGVSKEWCDFFQRLQIASWALLRMTLLGVCCLIMGVVAGFCHHYIKPKQELKCWARAYLLVAPVAFQVGLIQYYVSTNDFSTLVGPAEWSFGWAFTVALVLGSLSWTPLWIMLTFAFPDEADEDSSNSDSDFSNFAQGDYGAVLHGLAAPLFGGPNDDAEQGQGGSTPPLAEHDWQAARVRRPGPVRTAAHSEPQSEAEYIEEGAPSRSHGADSDDSAHF